MPGNNNGWSPSHGCTKVMALLSAECTNHIDGGSLKNKNLFGGYVILGSRVSVVDPFLLEMKVRHSDRSGKVSSVKQMLLRYAAVKLRESWTLAAGCLELRTNTTASCGVPCPVRGKVGVGHNGFPLPSSARSSAFQSYP